VRALGRPRKAKATDALNDGAERRIGGGQMGDRPARCAW
jgi:hypothetical protein